MRNILVGAAAVAMMTFASVAAGDAQPVAGTIDDGVYRPGSDQATLNDVQLYVYLGHHYCWYDGWHGPGWYWCGYGWRRGYGWGGGYGWRGWHHGGYRGAYYRRGYYHGGYHHGGYHHGGSHHGWHGGHHGGSHHSGHHHH